MIVLDLVRLSQSHWPVEKPSTISDSMSMGGDTYAKVVPVKHLAS